MKQFEIETERYLCIIEAECTHYHYNEGVHTLPNGDPGYPPSEDYEISFGKFTVHDEDEEITDPEIIRELRKECEDIISNDDERIGELIKIYQDNNQGGE